MKHLPEGIHRGRYVLFLGAAIVALYVAGMMVVGSVELTEVASRWTRTIVTICCPALAMVLVQSAAFRGKPRWLFKSDAKAASQPADNVTHSQS